MKIRITTKANKIIEIDNVDSVYNVDDGIDLIPALNIESEEGCCKSDGCGCGQ